MSVEEIKNHLDEKGKYLIKNNHFKVDYLHESRKDIISIFLNRYSLHFFIYDDVDHEKDFAIHYENSKDPYYCDVDSIEEFVKMIDKWIDKENEILEYVKTINKETIISKLRKFKIEKIINT